MRVMAVVALLFVVAACGGGPSEPTTQATTSTAQTASSPATSVPTGDPVPEALQRFRCRADDKGNWQAFGYLVNSGKAAATYQVTVFVGEPSGGAQQGKTKQVANVGAGASVSFTIHKIPAPESGGTCHVQVLATS